MNSVASVVHAARRPVIVSLHGIRTAGTWQKSLVTPLAAAGAIPVALDFGYFSALKLITRRQREQRVMWLRDEIERVRVRFPHSPMSIVAHSFGSYLAAALLESHSSVCFETMILSGSIVRPDFPWSGLLDSRRVGFVCNYVGQRDIWPRVASWAVRGAGDSGSAGFDQSHPALYQHYSADYAHADYFNPLHFEHFWLPALIYPQRALLDDLLCLTARARATMQDFRALQLKVRCRLFVSHPARPGRYWTMPAMQAADPEVPFTANELGYVLSADQARERPDLLPPTLDAIGGTEPVVWTRDTAATSDAFITMAAIGWPIHNGSGGPTGLLSLELLSRDPALPIAELPDLVPKLAGVMQTFDTSLAHALDLSI